MDPRIPNKEERIKLQKMVRFYKTIPLYNIGIACFILALHFLSDDNQILKVLLIFTLIIVSIYILLNFALLKRCPRCSSWGTPGTKGNCPKCGLHLDPTRKNN